MKTNLMNKNLLTLFLMMIIPLLSNSCTEKQKTDERQELPNKTGNTVNIQDLIGSTYEWKYKEYTYHITLTSDSTVHWKLIKGDYPGATEETDTYVYSQLDKNKIFISWIEKSGLGISAVLDFETMNLYTHGSQEGSLYVNPGKIKKIK
ncbi:hypothetical protein MP477_18015 [Chryseobacterium sp. WG23]|uniref:MoaF-related domain-containing protein n=1 Tax=Chryseobacterium sp. WG23 TaxID=2926910 RepID=UPI00211E32CF|nr:hypothetical protein [Chryseobacterium sp. WG23]MCQ9636853.1 hypothetical protein [Chryseobacterium sp. WG23]